jgi:hypothetical protein
MKSRKTGTQSGKPEEMEVLAQMAAFELGLGGCESLFQTPVADSDLIIPGCADLQVAAIQRIGHRGEFPKPVEWENLLAMLEPGQELLWIVTKQPRAGFQFHLALKSNPTSHSPPSRTQELRSMFRSVLGQFTKRSFPESLAEECQEDDIVDLLTVITQSCNGEVVVTSGYPSPSVLEDSREFPEPTEKQVVDASLNDIVEPFAEEDSFSVVFTVGRASPDEANQQLTRMGELRTALSPFLKVQKSENASRSVAKQRGTQRSRAQGSSQTENRNLLSTLFQSVFGSRADEVRQTYARHEHDPNASAAGNFMSWTGKGLWRGLWQKGLKKAPVMQSLTVTESYSESLTETEQTGSSVSLTSSDALLELLDQKLQEGIRSLKKAAGTGAFFFGAEVFSQKTELSLRLSRSITGSLAGARTHIRPFQTIIHRGLGCFDHLLRACTLDEVYPAITTQSRHVAALFLPLPEADLPGLKTKRNVFYGKPNPSERLGEGDDGSEAVWLGDLAHLTSGFKARDLPSLPRGRGNSVFRIPAEDMTSHLLIAGTTGSGKTQRAAALLNSLSRARFQVVVIESAKKTYRSLLRRRGVATKILALGANGSSALRINPFYFEPGTSLKRHISIFSDALADLLPVEALIGPKLREAIQSCYTRYEWDVETGKFRGTGVPTYPTMVDLHMEVIAIVKALRYGPELNSNYEGALLGRTRLFFDELYQDIFGWGGSHSLSEMFGDDDIILEMDALPPSEAKMPSFVLSLLLERMRSWQQAAKDEGNSSKRDLIIVIEEAHNLLEKGLEKQQSGHEMGSGGFLLKQIVRLLQEGREAGMGIVVVDQSPASLADAVIRNTNTKIILRIADSEEAERIGSTLGLTKEECRDLHDLEDGEAVVKVKNAGKALKLCPAQMVERLKASFEHTSPVADQPDYYRAAKSIRAIAETTPRQPSEPSDERPLIENPALVNACIADLLDSAGNNEDAKRFFAQKVVASICEVRSITAPGIYTHAPTLPELTLRVFGLMGWKSVQSLKMQLSCLLVRSDWETARNAFIADSSAFLPTLDLQLQTFLCWKAMDGSSDFVEFLRRAISLPETDPGRGDAYRLALQMAHASTDRFECLQRLLLQLTH